VSHLVFPDRVTIRVGVWSPTGTTPYSGASMAFETRTFAREKNDYLLGPFFSDESGILTITRRDLELSTQAELSSGLMDYASITNSYSFVAISHLSREGIARYVDSRTMTWTRELDGEKELYGSVAQLLDRLRSSANGQFRPATPAYGQLRDEWDGSRPIVEYDYRVSYPQGYPLA
jgi:hypothetical protein